MNENLPASTAAAEIDRLGMRLSGLSLIAKGFVIETELARAGDAAIVAVTSHKDPKRALYAPAAWLKSKAAPSQEKTTVRTTIASVAAALAISLAAASTRAEPARLDDRGLDRITAAGTFTIAGFATITWSGALFPDVISAGRRADGGIEVTTSLARASAASGRGEVITSPGLAVSITSFRP